MMPQIINFLITLAEMVGLRGVSSYSRASSAYNAVAIVLFALCIFLNFFLGGELFEAKKQIAQYKIQANEIAVLKNNLMESEAAVKALSNALSMFIPQDSVNARRNLEERRQQMLEGRPSLTQAPAPEPTREPVKPGPKPLAIPQRDNSANKDETDR